MTPIFKLLYDHILERSILDYCRGTDYYQHWEEREQLARRLLKQLSDEQRTLLEELLAADAAAQEAELEAMFQAAFHHAMVLARGS